MNDWIVSKVIPTDIKALPELADGKSIEKNPILDKPEIEVIPPITEYERINHHPYIYDYLKLKDSGIVKDALYDSHYKPNLREIDRFIIKEIDRNKLKPTVESYNQIIGKIKNYLSVGINDLPDKIINKFKVYISVIKTQRRYEKKIKDTLKQLQNLEGEQL